MCDRFGGVAHNKVCIISGGDININYVNDFLKNHPCGRIICVDGGLRYAYEAGIQVDEIVGDFDTIQPEILEHYRKNNDIKIHKYNPMKDSTDTDIALELAISWEPECIYIFGAIGSRLDHTLGNIHILKKTLKAHVKTYIINENNRIFMIDDSIQIEKKEVYGDYISFIPFTEKVENLTLKGFQYPLDNYTMVFGESLGISNEIIDETAEVIFSKGILLVIETLD